MKDRWRSRRIGIDIDSHNRLNLLKTYFNARYFFPGARIEVKATAQGFHFRIFQQHTIKQNLKVRMALGDDPMRIFADEQRMYIGLEEWVDTLFSVKAKGGKINRERDCNVLSLPFCSRLPCRKN